MRFDTPYNKHDTPPHRNIRSSETAQAKSGSRSWNTWWSRRSPNILTNDNAPRRIGIDVGSKTVKLVALDESGHIVFALYHRHRSDVRTTLAELFHDVIWRYGDMELPTAITGSAGIALADELGIPFVQEVVATTNAVRKRYPEANCIIELGGEDAKITYLDDPVEQRMNATCAGGTGDFIDGIASMLGVRTREFSKCALGSVRTYEIASRCAVFAQTDVRPLINAGASKSDIAQSALDAVARQTLGGLACGRPICETVVFLGGPFEHIPALVMTFRRKLALDKNTGIKPPDAHLFTAMGAIETAENPPVVALSELERRTLAFGEAADQAGSLPPLFENPDDRARFQMRHKGGNLPAVRLGDARGPFFLGFDAGSTTCKCALIDSDGALVASDYRDVEGDTFSAARSMLEGVLLAQQSSLFAKSPTEIAYATVTGYGEDLLQAGLGFDSGVVETVAHLRAAQQFKPDVSFVLDIGGQDMKALWVKNGVVVDAVLNEACSSGCGAFVQSSAKSLKLGHAAFSQMAFTAKHPIDLGAKCTVFMTSRVRHAQKSGASKGDIAAGIAYSVVNNVMTRIIGRSHALPLGDSVVVQGGTFKSDAVLRAFENVAGIEVTRPNAAHLMGAYGAALIARDTYLAGKATGASSLATLEEVRAMAPRKSIARCPGCGNACAVSIVDFGGSRRFLSGNKCERAYDALFGDGEGHGTCADSANVHGSRSGRSGRNGRNVVSLQQKLIAGFGDVRGRGARGHIAIGIMNVMNVYESIPFWHTLVETLGFSIIMPDDERSMPLRDHAAETVPSESVCHPAKLAHLRYAYLVERGADYVFMPRFERGTRCPVACGYACALADNVGHGRLASPCIKAIRPKAFAKFPRDRETVFEVVSSWVDATCAITRNEFDAAFAAALAAQQAFERHIADASEEAIAWTHDSPERRVAVIAGRPYHIDPALIHRIDEELSRLGFAVIPMLGLASPLHEKRAKQALWKPSKHLLELVDYAADDPQMEIVALRSFGCLFDAVSFDEAHDRANEIGRPFTELKIDDIANTAHIRIRLRTLAYTSDFNAVPTSHVSHAPADGETDCGNPRRQGRRAPVTPDLCSTAKELVRIALDKAGDQVPTERITVPATCKECLNEALPFELEHISGIDCRIEERTLGNQRDAPSPLRTDARKVGLVGNPLIVFNPELNDHVAKLIESLGWQVVYPDVSLLEVEDVRYIDQLEAFRASGVERVIYLQSFGCLKGHVQSRGAARELQQRFSDLSITVIDYDPESSALNRENRIRLALAK